MSTHKILDHPALSDLPTELSEIVFNDVMGAF